MINTLCSGFESVLKVNGGLSTPFTAERGFRKDCAISGVLYSDKGLIPVLILLDLSATFDITDHNILLQRLEHLHNIQCLAQFYSPYISFP